MASPKVEAPAGGQKITIQGGKLNVPDRPIIPFIEGDGTGPDIWRASVRVLDAAVEKAYGGKRKLEWVEVYAGGKSHSLFNTWLPDQTVEAFREYLVGIKGPLTTPIGGGIRSLNVALRQLLDLYVCLRPVRWFKGVPSPVKHPEKVDMVIFRENTEDVYSGVEFEAGSADAKKLLDFIKAEFPASYKKIRFPETSGVGIKPVSREGSERLIRSAIEYAVANGRKSVTLVHKGNIMKFTEGAFRDWGYEVARREFAAETIDAGPFCRIRNPRTGRDILIKDCLIDAFSQTMLLRPVEFDVIATPNLNGDYLSSALAAQVGGAGIAPGANMSDSVAVFEATHGTSAKYAGKDYVNPSSEILSGRMMLQHMGWHEAAELILPAMERTIQSKRVTYDFARQMEGATQVSCSGFGESVIANMA